MASGCKLGNWVRDGSQQISFSTILFNKVTAVNQTKQNPWVFKSLWLLYILRKCKVIHFVVGFLRVVTKDWKLLWSLPPVFTPLPAERRVCFDCFLEQGALKCPVACILGTFSFPLHTVLEPVDSDLHDSIKFPKLNHRITSTLWSLNIGTMARQDTNTNQLPTLFYHKWQIWLLMVDIQ